MKPSPIQMLMARITGGRYRPAPILDLVMVIVWLVAGWIILGVIWLAIVMLFSV